MWIDDASRWCAPLRVEDHDPRFVEGPRQQNKAERATRSKVGLRRLVVARFGAGMLSQGLSSATNLVVGLAVAHTGTPAQFGLYAVVIGFYHFILSVCRAYATTQMFIDGVPNQDRASGDLTLITLVALGMSALSMLFCLAFSSLREPLVLVLAAGLAALLLQDGTRQVAFASDTAWKAAVLDTVAFFVTGTIAVLAVILRVPVVVVVVGWVLAAAMSSAVGVKLTRFRFSCRLAARSATHDWRNRANLSFDAAVIAGLAQAVSLLTALLGGLTLTAGIRVLSGNVFGAVNVLIQGAQPQILITARQASTASAKVRAALLPAGLISVLVVGVGVVVDVVPELGYALGGGSYIIAEPYLWPMAAVVIGTGTSACIVSALRLCAGSLYIRRMRAGTSTAFLALLTVGLVDHRPLALQASLLAGAAVTVLVPSACLVLSLRRSESGVARTHESVDGSGRCSSDMFR